MNNPLFVGNALVFVLTFFGGPVVPQARAGTAALSVHTFGGGIAGLSTLFSSSAFEPISDPGIFANALFSRGVTHFDTLGVDVAIFTGVVGYWDTVTIVHALVTIITLGNGTLVLDFTHAVHSVVTRGTNTVADLLAIAGHGDVGDLSIFASGVGAGVYEYLTDESVALEAGFAFTIVVGLRHHLSVRHAVGVFITVVLFTRVNRFTHESVSVKSWVTLALVVDLISDNL